MEARRRSVIDDHDHLAALGIKQELQRNFNPLSLLGLAFATLNSWTALSTSLSLALPSGGSTSVLWGLVTAAVCILCLSASLAEFLSAYPTAGGQYHWAAAVSWKRSMPAISWITGWGVCFGWMALTATGGLLGSSLIVGLISLYDASYDPKRWHQFLIYIAYNLIAAVFNAFGTSLLPLMGNTAMAWSIIGFVVISITILACAAPDYNSGYTVFELFINETGWPDGVAFLLGLLQGGFGLVGFDAVAHMIEEIPNAVLVGPQIMIGCVAMGAVTGFIFLMCLLFVAGDLTAVISSVYGPLGAIYYNATGSKAGTVCLVLFSLVCLLFATTSLMTTSSRMNYAFARDGGLPFSKLFSRVHPRLNVPLEALGLTNLVAIIFGCIFLGSTSAYNAIVSASVVSVSLSYGVPVLINIIRGRKMLPADRAFVLPAWFAWPANVLGVVYVLVTSVFFLFPPELPVTGTNMNYAVAALAIVAIVSGLTWIFEGRHSYKGPVADVDPHILTAMESPAGIAAANGGEHYGKEA